MISRLNFNSEEKREVKTGIALESGEDYFQARLGFGEGQHFPTVFKLTLNIECSDRSEPDMACHLI